MACHEAAFAFFGGTPLEVPQHAHIGIGRDAYGPGQHRLQPEFRDFAQPILLVLPRQRPLELRTRRSAPPLPTGVATAGKLTHPTG